MKKNQRYKLENSVIQVNKEGLAILNDGVVLFEKDEIRHTSRKIEYWENGKMHSNVLLTNNFELEPQEIIAIYKRRWQIETLFKQLKQNFPLKYFFGESVNAIQIQIWVALIANLLISIVQKQVKRRWSF